MTDTPKSLGDSLRDWVAEHRETIIQGLSRLIQFPTVSGGETEEERRGFERSIGEAQLWLMGEADRWGMRTRRLPLGALIIEGGEASECIGVPLHLDVVPPGEGWRHGSPFSGTVEEGQIWGRGAQDNKGSLMAVLHAVAAILTTGRTLRRQVRLIIGNGEETGEWEDVVQARDTEGSPTLCIVPDSSFPLVIAEKGWTNIEVRAHCEESSAPVRLERLWSGDRPNIVPDLAEAELIVGEGGPSRDDVMGMLAVFGPEHEEHSIEVRWSGPGSERCHAVAHGKRAHGSSPHRGRNAALDLLSFLCSTFGDGMGEGVHALLSQLESDCHDLNGGAWGIWGDDELLGPSTVNLGTLRWDGTELRAVLNIRPTRGQTAEGALQGVRSRLTAWHQPGGLRLSADRMGKGHHDPLIVDTEDLAESITACSEAWRAVTGTEPKHLTMSGTTYAKVFPRSIGFGPCWDEEEPGLFHQVDERIPVASHLRNVRLYAEALGRLIL
ncbi:Sapep family Mn(2+)-dependent dipeptidase [Candidatus Sumerlaeota bacterium]|nr:Sapep family Mn(2+)-dependent dipeptidase [Candidatus Sumerlaeota bacterium]